MTKPSVLFVCMGNICRSPAGEAVLQKLVRELELHDRIKIDSAGTHAYHIGELADQRMRRAGKRRGLLFESRARKITEQDLTTFQVIIAMDRENYSRIMGLGKKTTADIRMLSDFLNGDWPEEVPDPYYGGATGFEMVLDMIEEACPAIVRYLLGEESLPEK